MFKIIDAIVVVILIVGTAFGMWYVNGLHKQGSLQLHELSEEITHLRIIIENQKKQMIKNKQPWNGV